MNSATTQDRGTTLPDDTATWRSALRERRFADLLASTQRQLARDPSHREALLFRAIAQRGSGQIPQALATLSVLQAAHPRFSRTYEERGRCYVELRQAPQAIEAFSESVKQNPALLGSWRMLEALYRLVHQTELMQDAAQQVQRLQLLPAEVLTASASYYDGDLDAAETLTRRFLLSHGDHVEAMRLLAQIGMARQVYDDAELLLSAVLQISPDYRAARQDYVNVLIELHKHEEAKAQLRVLMRDGMHDRELRTLEAFNEVGIGDHERAIAIYSSLLEASPRDAELHLSIGHGMKTIGRAAEAVASYRQAAACRPDFGDAYWSLANLKTYRFTDEELAHMRATEALASTSRTDRVHFCFALGKALEDREQYAESFDYYMRGNALKRAESPYSRELIEATARRQIELCTPAFFQARTGWGDPSEAPIFVIGLPRSGSTLIEQILASHSQVEGTHELANIPQMARTLRGRDPDPAHPRYPAILGEMSAEEFRQLGGDYLHATRLYRTGKPHFIDKMPNNLRHVGLIHLMLPNARIIDARREPMACCFSNLKQLFARGQEFTYDIDDIARYYRTYLALMQHWRTALPGRILIVQHEDLVQDLEGQVRRILDYCGLPFESSCLEFHRTERSVRTASAEQVRRPISREGLEQWRHFEPWLEPLRAALGDALTRYRE